MISLVITKIVHRFALGPVQRSFIVKLLKSDLMVPNRQIYANILLDDWFKRTFGTEARKKIMELFLRELIPEHDIVELTYVNTEHTNPIEGKRDVRVDVECMDRDGTRFVVEMQLARQAHFYERALLNSTFAIQEQSVKGDINYDFPTVYFIALLDFSFHGKDSRPLYKYAIREETSGELMTPRLKYYILELPNCSKALTAEASIIDNFCYTLHNMSSFTSQPEELKDELFNLLFDSAEIATFTPKEKAKYEFDMTTERDIQNFIDYARQEGREEAKIENARSLLMEGVNPETIAKALRLPLSQVEGLK